MGPVKRFKNLKERWNLSGKERTLAKVNQRFNELAEKLPAKIDKMQEKKKSYKFFGPYDLGVFDAKDSTAYTTLHEICAARDVRIELETDPGQISNATFSSVIIRADQPYSASSDKDRLA